jgi:hypothetical protein
MTTPARDAALAGQEPGPGSLVAGAEHSQAPAPAVAHDVIAQVRQSVQVWINGDQVLPADGSFLLAALDQARAGLTSADAPGARAGIERFVGQVQALIEAGTLEASDGHSSIETAIGYLSGFAALAGPREDPLPPR